MVQPWCTPWLHSTRPRAGRLEGGVDRGGGETRIPSPAVGIEGYFFQPSRISSRFAFYTLGALLCGLAQSADFLIAARVIQGIGIGGHIALTQSLAARLVVPRFRAQVNGVMSVSQILATVSGPLIGALFVGIPVIGWRLCFLIGVPVAIVASIVVHRVIPRALPHAEGRVDYVGALLLVSGLTGLLGWVSFVGNAFSLISSTSLLILLISLLLLVVAGFWEWRHPYAIVPLQALVGRVPALAALGSLSVGASMFGGTIFVTQYLQLGRGFSALVAGLMLMPMALSTFIAAVVVGRLCARTGRIRRYLIVGTVSTLLGNVALMVLSPTTPLWWIIGATSLIGAGLGMTATNFILVAQNATRLGDVGAVSGTIIFCRTMGSTVGLAVFGAIVAMFVPAVDLVPAHKLPELYSEGSALVFLVASAITFVGLIAVVALPSVRLRSTADLEEADLASTPYRAPTD